jgi:3-hydroxybutyryl-CoA dehydrogenase
MQTVAVLGAGIMGHGIAQVFASAGHTVHLYDSNTAALDNAMERIASNMRPFVELGLMDEASSRRCMEGIQVCHELSHACDGCDLVIEAVVEDLEIKQNLFDAVEKLVASSTVLCSNTSALSITELASKLDSPDRMVGTHFWNPPHVLRCVEVVKGQLTSTDVFEAVVAVLEQVGKIPVRVQRDIPGFLGNRLQHALQREAIYLLEQGVCDPEDLDNVVKHGFGLRYALMGPIERADLGGIDVTYAVQKYLLPYLDARPTPSPLLAEKVKRNELGIKTGQGFFSWTRQKITDTVERRDKALLRIISLMNEMK